jgi:uncharacterized membrane protein
MAAMPRRPNQSIWIFRWVLTALALSLAIALIARGSVLIGVLVAALAIVRTAMFVMWHRRIRERYPNRFQ